jgi:crotonobetainyl-CoA:carnitine CoA-transferase CaiB-like acyl-CoA transferase
MRSLPLDGYRVLDVTVSWGGPRAITLLADLGADVIKVESIQYYNTTRGGRADPPASEWGIFLDRDPGDQPWNRCARHSAIERNKRGITLNLQHPDGRRLLDDLIRVSDVVAHAYRPRVSRKLGLDYDSVRTIQPDAIVLSLPLFGHPGPYAEFGGVGSVTEAASGHQLLRAYPNSEPTWFFYGDVIAGSAGAFGVLAALAYRDETGIGQHVEVAQAEASIPLLGEYLLDVQLNGRVAQAIGNENSSMAPHGCYRCSGVEQYVAIAVEDDAAWTRFCRAIGRPELIDDSRYRSVVERYHQRRELDVIVEGWTQLLTRDEVVDRLVAADVAVAAVLDHLDFHRDPQILAREFFRPATHPVAGTHPWPAGLWHFSETSRPDPRAAATLGQHNEEVLGELLGLGQHQLNWLAEAEVIGTVPLGAAHRTQR